MLQRIPKTAAPKVGVGVSVGAGVAVGVSVAVGIAAWVAVRWASLVTTIAVCVAAISTSDGPHAVSASTNKNKALILNIHTYLF